LTFLNCDLLGYHVRVPGEKNTCDPGKNWCTDEKKYNVQSGKHLIPQWGICGGQKSQGPPQMPW
jgi:hypothetical protein